MRYCIPWTTEETERLTELKSLGRTNQNIALLLDRTVFAVKSRFTQISKLPQPAQKPIVRIAHADVAGWYELGWRFDGFIPGGLCRMEWRGSGPKREQQTRQIVTNHITRGRVTEAA